MADETVWAGSTEADPGVRAAQQTQPDLAESKEIEMVDEESSDEHRQPTAYIQSIQSQSPGAGFDIPDHTTHGLPFPEHQQYSGAAKKQIGTAFDGSGNDAGPHSFEPGTRHNGMLKCEQSNQKSIDGQGLQKRHVRSRIDGPRKPKIPDETKHIRKSYQRNGIADDAIDECRDSTEHGSSFGRAVGYNFNLTRSRPDALFMPGCGARVLLPG